MDRTRHGGNVRPGRLSISGAFLYPESHLRFAYLIRDCRLEIIALKRCATTASRRLRTGAENRAFPGPVPEPAEGGPGRVLLALYHQRVQDRSPHVRRHQDSQLITRIILSKSCHLISIPWNDYSTASIIRRGSRASIR